jgi:3-methyladenine DNA glycosylase AlkD
MTARDAVAWLERKSSRRIRDEQRTRYGITAANALGVPMSSIQQLARLIGRDHALAEALWKTGVYEARLLAAYVDEPERVTAAQMDRWARDFDNWGVCDTLCFALFDRSPHAWGRVAPWCRRPEEFVRRAGFALLACLAGHDRTSSDAPFLRALKLVPRGATDERNFVMKGVSWALRGTGRRSPALHAAATAIARELSGSDSPSARWIGRTALRELGSPAVKRALARRGSEGRAGRRR